MGRIGKESRKCSETRRRRNAATLVTNDTNCFYETRKKIGAYDLGPTLGEGAFATVRASKGGETYACKIINTARMNEELCTKEIEMMRRAGKHANLVSLIDVVELPDARALVLELATGGEVFERICEKGCYSEKDAALVAKQVALALKHLHGRGIAHRDLKPENLLLCDAHDADVKLCDLGIAAAPCEKLDKEWDAGLCGSRDVASDEEEDMMRGATCSRWA